MKLLLDSSHTRSKDRTDKVASQENVVPLAIYILPLVLSRRIRNLKWLL